VKGSSTVKRSKQADSESDSDSAARSSTSSRKTSHSDGKSSKAATRRRSKASESDSSPRTSSLRSSTAKRTSSFNKSTKSSAKNQTLGRRKESRNAPSSLDKEEDSSPPLVNVPRYVDYYLLPGTTLTIHRKEFVNAELNYTAQAMATKLSSKVSRAIKKGTYTPRSQLPPNAPLQRPPPLATPSKPLVELLHAIAVDLRTNRREPPRPAMLS